MRAFYDDETNLWTAEDGVVLKHIPANGLLWHSKSLEAYRFVNDHEASSTGWTFEDAQWTGPWWSKPLIGVFNIVGVSGYGPLNPFSFATVATAVRVHDFVKGPVRATFGNKYAVSIETITTTGLFGRTPERHIKVTNMASDKSELFSAGVIGANIARIGYVDAVAHFIADVRQASL